MNLCKTTMKLLAAILFATVTIAMASSPVSKIISNIKTNLDTLGKMFHRVSAKKCNIKNIKGTGGAVYIRWGHNLCPGQSSLVYSGYAGGSHYTNTGGAVDILCLSKTPTTSSDRRSYTKGQELWGTEYKLGDKRIHQERNHDLPCAVCQSKHRANFLMLPGRDICPRGWEIEYKGLLTAGYRTHMSASQYVCVDNARKTVPGGEADKDGKLLYPVKANCHGSLKCPPYRHEQLITCAVCTH